MGGDYTRLRFNSGNDVAEVLQQQGRVMLDQDWNELVEVMDRRWRAETVDIIGTGVVPKQTPNGFQIQVTANNDLTIGPGRIYVDGLLAENHGLAPQFDHVLEEMPGTQPLPYEQQPYVPQFQPGPWPFPTPNPFQLPTDAGPHLVFLDVWKREVTYLEAPDLVDPAVGVDTATRVQTAWQVKVLPDVGAGTTCATPGNQIPGWIALITRSAGLLTTAAAGVPASTDPCIVPPNSGYRGADNRTYRVEIHTAGGFGAAQFKYSRNNASVASQVTGIDSSGTVLTVVRTKRDSQLRFSPDVWVEVTDDWHEFAGIPGEMHQVQVVDDNKLTVTLKTALTANTFNFTSPAQRNTRVILWDQHGKVFDTNNNLISDVDANGGLINVPQNATVVLEDGVQLTFSLDSSIAGGQFKFADYWIFAARVIDSSVEILTNAVPRGIHHHFCRLAVVTFPSGGNPMDCRVFWPPEFGGSCECVACVTADGHNQGTFTIQMAIDQVKKTGGKVCLGPGTYNLTSTINISGVSSLRITGEGGLVTSGTPGLQAATILLAPEPEPNVSTPAILIGASSGIVIEELQLNFSSATTSQTTTGAGNPILNPGIMVQNSFDVVVQRCTLLSTGNQNADNPAIAFGGFGVGQTTIRENTIQFNIQDRTDPGPGTGIANLAPEHQMVSFDLYLLDNLLSCGSYGVHFDNQFVHFGQVTISDNFIGPCGTTGIAIAGSAKLPQGPNCRVEINGNEITGTGNGIDCGVFPVRIRDNDLFTTGTGAITVGNLGLVVPPVAIALCCEITGNRIFGASNYGVRVLAQLEHLMISENVVQQTGTQGIVVETGAATTITKNHLLGLAPNASSGYGILVYGSQLLEVEGNVIAGVATSATQNGSRFGIVAFASAMVRIAGNHVVDIGPTNAAINPSAGIALVGPTDRAEVTGNVVRRSSTGASSQDLSLWRGLYIGSVNTFQEALKPFFSVAPAANRKLFIVTDTNITEVNGDALEHVLVKGNYVEASGGAPGVEVAATVCGFTENQCILLAGATGAAPPPGAAVAGDSLIAGNNWFTGGVPNLNLTSPRFTVLGNIGTVNVNGAALGQPWAALNS